MEYPESYRYTEEHEWLHVDGDVGAVGVTHHAQDALGDVVFVELPEVGRKVAKGDEMAVVESVKAASEVYAPVDGEVVEVNAALTDSPNLVNEAPQTGGWFVKLRLADPAQADALMDRAAYDAFLADLD